MALSHLVVFACVYLSSPQDPFWSFGERNARVAVGIWDVVSVGAGLVSTNALTAQKVVFMWLLEVKGWTTIFFLFPFLSQLKKPLICEVTHANKLKSLMVFSEFCLAHPDIWILKTSLYCWETKTTKINPYLQQEKKKCRYKTKTH